MPERSRSKGGSTLPFRSTWSESRLRYPLEQMSAGTFDAKE